MHGSLNEKKGDSSSSKSRTDNDTDVDPEFSYLDSIKSLFLVSLPHLTIILLFVIYVLVGAAILKEIEWEGPSLTEQVGSPPSTGLSPS